MMSFGVGSLMHDRIKCGGSAGGHP